MGRRILALGMTFSLCAACGEKVDDQPGFGPGSGMTMGSSGTDGSSGDASDTNPGTSSNGTTTSSSDSATTSNSTSSSGGTTTTATTGNTSNTTTGGGACGNGTIDAGEQCDGADLNGFDCTSLGYTGGTLSCDAVTCTFDTSMCMSGTSGTSG